MLGRSRQQNDRECVPCCLLVDRWRFMGDVVIYTLLHPPSNLAKGSTATSNK